MDDDEIKSLAGDASLDQFSATLASTARMVGSYYRHLKAAGLTEAQALRLTRDWHAVYWQRIYFPTAGQE